MRINIPGTKAGLYVRSLAEKYRRENGIHSQQILSHDFDKWLLDNYKITLVMQDIHGFGPGVIAIDIEDEEATFLVMKGIL